jgi:ribose 5-phosphate isomerase RpiB
MNNVKLIALGTALAISIIANLGLTVYFTKFYNISKPIIALGIDGASLYKKEEISSYLIELNSLTQKCDVVEITCETN